jgi:hypothetical protein
MFKFILYSLIVMAGYGLYASEYENVLLDIKRNIDNPEYAIKLGQHLSKNPADILPIRESLRHSVIISSVNRERLLSLMENSAIINKLEKEELLKQVDVYKEIVSKLENSVSNIDIELSYTTYSCSNIESRIYEPNVVMPFKRKLKISDVSAHQDFGRFAITQNILIVHVPSVDKVISHIENKELINLKNFEQIFVYNNATATSMYSKVENGKDTYYMFPYKLYPYETNNLSKLTALEYGYFALNLKNVGLLTPEIYNTFKKIYRRNASLCLYSKK